MTLKELRDRVAAAAAGGPSLSVWLDRLAHVDPGLDAALEGYWCGRDGSVLTEPVQGEHCVRVGWHSGHVEYAYLS